jgi:hypothetical protein
MRIFELLTAVIDDTVSPCTEKLRGVIEQLLVLQEEALARYEVLSPLARGEMIASLREELVWRARLHASSRELEAAAGQWLTAQRELLDQFAKDSDELELKFFAGRSTGQISTIALDLSDRHEGAHAVAILTFASGDRVVYKPRSLEAERWFYGFLEELNKLAPPFAFASLNVLHRERSGWVEFAPHRRCDNNAELRDYYHHAGSLLCLLRLLRVSDCHFQNIVARGALPVLVDAETIFHPGSDNEPNFTIADTGMLPTLLGAYNLGALSCVTQQEISLELPGFATSAVTLTPRENLPFHEDHCPCPDLFVEEMSEGFARTWEFITLHRDGIASLLESSRDLRVRILRRDTPEYYRQMLLLALGMETDSTLSTTELEALRKFEIPRFTVIADGPRSGAIVSGAEAALQEIAVLDEALLARQLKMLRLVWMIYGSMRGMASQADKMTPA